MSNDPRTLEAAVFTIEQDLQEDECVGISKPFQVNPLEERTSTPPRDVVSDTPANSPKTVHVYDVAVSSLLFIWDLLAI